MLKVSQVSYFFVCYVSDEQTSQQTGWTLDETLREPVQQHELLCKYYFPLFCFQLLSI